MQKYYKQDCRSTLNAENVPRRKSRASRNEGLSGTSRAH